MKEVFMENFEYKFEKIITALYIYVNSYKEENLSSLHPTIAYQNRRICNEIDKI